MPRIIKSTMSSNSSSNSSDSASITSPLIPPIYENLTDFLDVLTEQLTGYQSDTKNITYLEHAPKLNRATYLKVIVLTILSVLSLVGNLATIYSIWKNRQKQHGFSAIYTLILHLSVADLLVTIFCLAGEAIWSYNVQWLWGNAACKIFKFLQMFSLYLSTFILVLIGIDRFVAVRYPMKGLNKPQRCSRFVLVTWLLSFLFAIPQLVIFHVAQGPFVEVFTQCVTYGVYTERWQEQLYASFSLFFMFLLPLAILITTYICTVITLSRKSQKNFREMGLRMYNNSDVNRRRLMHRAKRRSLRISIVIVAAFLIWWTPYYTMMIIFLFNEPDDDLSEELLNGIFFFGMSNSLVNPLIYGAFHLWPQRQQQSSYQRTDASSQRNNLRRRETKMPLQDSSSKVIAAAQQPQI